jgi:hypothetical protein
MDPTDASTADLVKKALEDAKELIKLEVALAKDELGAELTRVRSAAVGLVLAQSVLIVSLSMALSAIAFATGTFVAFAVGAALVLAVVAGISGLLGYRKVARPFLSLTRQRLGDDVHEVKAHVHGT